MFWLQRAHGRLGLLSMAIPEESQESPSGAGFADSPLTLTSESLCTRTAGGVEALVAE